MATNQIPITPPDVPEINVPPTQVLRVDTTQVPIVTASGINDNSENIKLNLSNIITDFYKELDTLKDATTGTELQTAIDNFGNAFGDKLKEYILAQAIQSTLDITIKDTLTQVFTGITPVPNDGGASMLAQIITNIGAITDDSSTATRDTTINNVDIT